MSEPVIDSAQFFRRLERVQQGWKTQDAESDLSGVESLLLVAGGSDEDNPYRKTTAFQVIMQRSRIFRGGEISFPLVLF